MGVAQRKGVAGWREPISAHALARLEAFSSSSIVDFDFGVRSSGFLERVKLVADVTEDGPLAQGVSFDVCEKVLLRRRRKGLVRVRKQRKGASAGELEAEGIRFLQVVSNEEQNIGWDVEDRSSLGGSFNDWRRKGTKPATSCPEVGKELIHDVEEARRDRLRERGGWLGVTKGGARDAELWCFV
jgi:hypothetical protein